MFCTNCGKQLDSLAVYCPKCGCPINAQSLAKQSENIQRLNILSRAGIIAGIFFPIIGFICSTIGLCIADNLAGYDGSQIAQIRKRCKTGIIVSTVRLIIGIIADIAMYLLAFGSMSGNFLKNANGFLQSIDTILREYNII